MKPAKCFYHIILFSWRPDGSWRYELNETLNNLEISIPLADGSIARINHLPVSTSAKTLGQMTCPTGSSKGALQQMREKAQKWIDKARGGHFTAATSGFCWTSSSKQCYSKFCRARSMHDEDILQHAFDQRGTTIDSEGAATSGPGFLRMRLPASRDRMHYRASQ